MINEMQTSQKKIVSQVKSHKNNFPFTFQNFEEIDSEFRRFFFKILPRRS